jgi:glucokinase
MNSKSRNVLTLGVDLGGTKINTALIDLSGNIIYSHYRFINPAKDPDVAITEIIDSAQICVKESGKEALALGLGVAGQIDKDQGIVRSSPNLPDWKNVPLKSRLESSLQIPVTVNNDVRVSTWGEWQHGAAMGLTDFVCLFVGTGVGGGVVSKGQILEGSHNTAGELGHMTVVAAGRKCHCPNEGCLEAYVGGWAIAERTQDAVRANPEAGKLLISIAGNISDISAITVSQAYHINDPLASRIIKDTSKYLSAGLVTIVNTFNPCLIILGGGVIQGLPELIILAEKRVRTFALQSALENLKISCGSLGDKAGVIGAAALARTIIQES